MRYENINKNLFIKNRVKLFNLLENNSLAIIFSTKEKHRNGDQNYAYRQNSDFFYFTGIEQENSIFLIVKENFVVKEFLFLLKPYAKKETWEGKVLTKKIAENISGISNILWINEFDETIKLFSENKEHFYGQEKLKLTKLTRFKNSLLNINKQIKIEYLTEITTKLRLVKEPEEIELIKKAINITKEAFTKILHITKANKKEYEIEAEITYIFNKNGCNSHAYLPIVASGKNACSLHYIKNDSVLKNGDLLLLDFGAEYANYASDLSRTIPVSGKFSERQKELYNAVLDVQQKATKLLVPGNTINKLNAEVNKLMEQKMIDLKLFTKKEAENQDPKNPLFFKYYMHGTSHFMGLDVHDVGTKDTIFKKNMVLTCEPGIYIEAENIGIRIENDIIIDDNPINLMESFPTTIEEIEEYMNAKS